MAMVRCPICGERYSDTYRDCPFCEEEEALREGEEIRRRPQRGKRMAHGRRFSLITPTLIVLILMMAGVLYHLLHDGDPSDRIDRQDQSGTPPAEDVQPPAQPDDAAPPDNTAQQGNAAQPDETQEPGETQEPDETQEPGSGGVMPEDPGTDTDEPAPDASEPSEDHGAAYNAAMALPGGLSLSKTDFSLFEPGESAALRASGGSGSYEWISQDEGVASVDESGKVVAVSRGTVNIVATDGEKKGVCVVRVKISGGGSQSSAPATAPGTTPDANAGSSGSGSYSLNRTDFTRSTSEGPFQLKVSGGASGVRWTSSNPGVAAVDASGNVTAVSAGTATITASWDGKSLTCIVRVPG